MIILGSPFSFVPGTLQSAIERLGLTSGLKLCLDASDINSYSGSGQSWLDTSGNGYDFFRGAGSGAAADDPTFNGSAGGQSASEYWSFDGGDFFTYDSANETWMTNLHKNNAKFALAAWVYLASTGSQQPIMGTAINPSLTGVAAYISSGGVWAFTANNGTGSGGYNDGSINVPTGQWSFLSIVFDEAANTAVSRVNDTEVTLGATYVSPSSSAASNVLALGKADGSPDVFVRSGGRMASLAVWEGTNPSAAQIASLHDAMRGKFGV